MFIADLSEEFDKLEKDLEGIGGQKEKEQRLFRECFDTLLEKKSSVEKGYVILIRMIMSGFFKYRYIIVSACGRSLIACADPVTIGIYEERKYFLSDPKKTIKRLLYYSATGEQREKQKEIIIQILEQIGKDN